jgi:hypothetical protein
MRSLNFGAAQQFTGHFATLSKYTRCEDYYTTDAEIIQHIPEARSELETSEDMNPSLLHPCLVGDMIATLASLGHTL